MITTYAGMDAHAATIRVAVLKAEGEQPEEWQSDERAAGGEAAGAAPELHGSGAGEGISGSSASSRLKASNVG